MNLQWTLPTKLEATQPPEARGLRRDAVRLMVSHYTTHQIQHQSFQNLPEFLQAGDLLVLNTSATLPAALDARDEFGKSLRIHLSTRITEGLWVVEIRQPLENGASQAFAEIQAKQKLILPEGRNLLLLQPYSYPGFHSSPSKASQALTSKRLWLACLDLPKNWHGYLQTHGRPTRYGYVPQDWPLDYYQTVFANEPGSAEMPSAGRAFTPELLTQLLAKGIQILPLVLHTGVSSLEAQESPYEEYYRIPQVTADAVNLARQTGRQIIAVGTTVVRALESAVDERAQVKAGESWTSLMITPQRGVKVVSGLLTGLHEPQATHLAMLEAIAGSEHIAQTYQAALVSEYLWHEFGDLHLILP